MPTAAEIIAALNLEPLQDEGGYFRQTWILPSDAGAPQGTAILYLIQPNDFSSLHRLDADEIFHFYMGDACEQLIIHPDHEAETRVIGHDILHGQLVQSVVPAGTWQGTRLVPGGQWALVGTTMTPGFHRDGFELATEGDLQNLSAALWEIATGYLADGA